MLEELRRVAPFGSPPPMMSLNGTRLLSACPMGAERYALESAALPPRAIKPHHDLIREDEATDQFYVVTDGWACRYKTMRDGSRQIVALLVPGDVANLDALMFARPGYGVRAFTAAKVVPILRERMTMLASEHPGIAKALIRLALIENTILSQWALCLGRRSALQRLAHLLCELAVRVGSDDAGDASSFDLPLTQEQLADALGLTAVHVNRTMQQLRTERLIVTESRTITLPDVPRLRKRAEFDPSYLHMRTAAASAFAMHEPTPAMTR